MNILCLIIVTHAHNVTFTPSLGLLRTWSPIDKLILKESVIEKLLNVNFSSPLITEDVIKSSSCSLFSRENSRMYDILDTMIYASFEKYVQNDVSAQNIMDDPLFVTFLNKKKVSYLDDNLLKGIFNYTVMFPTGYSKTKMFSVPKENPTTIELFDKFRCVESAQHQIFNFQRLEIPFVQVILSFLDAHHSFNHKFASNHVQIPGCSFRYIKSFTFVTTLVYNCEPSNDLMIKLYSWNAQFCKDYKVFTIIPITNSSRKKRQAVAAVAFSGGILMSTLFNRLIDIFAPRVDTISFDEIKGNQQKLRDSVLDLDKSLTVLETHTEDTFHQIDKHFCELSLQTELIREELISYMIMREFTNKVEYLLQSLDGGKIPIDTQLYSAFIQMCISLNSHSLDNVFEIENICKEIINSSVVLLQKLSVTEDIYYDQFHFSIRLSVQIPIFYVLRTLTYNLMTIPVSYSRYNDTFTYIVFNLPEYTFKYKEQEYKVDNTYCLRLTTYIYCKDNIHARIDLTDGCLKNGPLDKCQGAIVSSPDSCLTRKFNNYILVSSFFPIKVSPLTMIEKGLNSNENFVQHFSAGTHLIPHKGFTDIRISCHEQFIDFSFNRDIVDLEIVLTNNQNLTNLEIYSPLDINYTVHKSLDVKFETVTVHRYLHYVSFTLIIGLIILIGFLVYRIKCCKHIVQPEPIATSSPKNEKISESSLSFTDGISVTKPIEHAITYELSE